MEYHYRVDVFDKERTFRLLDDGVEITQPGYADRTVRYADVVDVKLKWNTGKTRTDIFYMDVSSRKEFPFRVMNSHYVTFATFENRNQQYRAFVLAFHDRLRPFARTISFRLGSTWLGYLASAATLVLAFGALGLVAVYLVTVKQWGLIALKAILLIWMVPRGLEWLRRNKPGFYDPDSIPADLLPAEPSGG